MTIVSTDPPRYYVYVYRSKLQYTVVTNDNDSRGYRNAMPEIVAP